MTTYFKSTTTYFESTTPGKTWSVDIGKDRTGHVAAFATEGELNRNDCGVTSFNFVMFQDRTESFGTDAKRATYKSQKIAHDGLVARLIATGNSTGERV